MTRKQKALDQFLTNPHSISLAQIEKILLDAGFVRIPAKGSHVKWKHVALSRDLIIPVHNNDCKDFYKKEASKFIIEVYKTI